MSSFLFWPSFSLGRVHPASLGGWSVSTACTLTGDLIRGDAGLAAVGEPGRVGAAAPRASMMRGPPLALPARPWIALRCDLGRSFGAAAANMSLSAMAVARDLGVEAFSAFFSFVGRCWAPGSFWKMAGFPAADLAAFTAASALAGACDALCTCGSRWHHCHHAEMLGIGYRVSSEDLVCNGRMAAARGCKNLRRHKRLPSADNRSRLPASHMRTASQLDRTPTNVSGPIVAAHLTIPKSLLSESRVHEATGASLPPLPNTHTQAPPGSVAPRYVGRAISCSGESLRGILCGVGAHALLDICVAFSL